MIGFVLSGGGNRGAQEVGALQVLLEHGVKPDLVIGTSAGAINATLLAANPTVAGTRQLAQLWQHATQDKVYPGSRWTTLWRLSVGEASLYPNTRFHDFVRANLRLAHLANFNDLTAGVRLYIVATRFENGTAHVFGDDENESLVDAIMATTALPPLHPPWHCGDTLYIDGAFVAYLPIRLAIERGTREIYALHITQGMGPAPCPSGVSDITTYAIDTFIQHQCKEELESARKTRGVTLHHIPLTAGMGIPFGDFGHAPMLIQAGRTAMETYFQESPQRAEKKRTWRMPDPSSWIRMQQAFVQRSARIAQNLGKRISL